MIFYIHGGPGFNSGPESEVIGSLLRSRGLDCCFWSDLDGQSRSKDSGNLFDLQVRALDRILRDRMTVVCHSYGAHPFIYLQQMRPRRGLKVVIVSPVLDLWSAHRRIMTLAHGDFKKTDKKKATEIKKCLEETRDLFDEAAQRGLSLAGEDADLFSHYWTDVGALQRFSTILAKSGKGLDLEIFFAVLRGLSKKGYSYLSNPIDGIDKLALLFGIEDPISSLPTESVICKKIYSGQMEVWQYEKVRHWPHMEVPERFTLDIQEFIAKA